MSDQSEHEALRLEVNALWRERSITQAALLKALKEAVAAHDTALEEAAKCAIDNQDCDAWEIAVAIRALKGAKP